jgi:thiol-disulfide isomerase/thioredoxin
MRRLFPLSFALWLAACGGAQSAPADARVTVVSLRKIDCAECGSEIVSDLRQRPGVYDATFDKRRAEISVTSSPSFDVFGTVKQLSASEGFEAVLGAGKGLYLDWATFPEGADVKTIARNGEDVPDLGAYLAKGKVTVVDFSAIWCMPCRKVDEHMARVLGSRQDVAYRKFDIGDWDSPLAQRYLKTVPQLPFVIVYDTSGAKVDAIAGVATDKLDSAIARGAKP